MSISTLTKSLPTTGLRSCGTAMTSGAGAGTSVLAAAPPLTLSNCFVNDSMTVLASPNSRCKVSKVSVFRCLDLAAEILFFILLISLLSLSSASVFTVIMFMFIVCWCRLLRRRDGSNDDTACCIGVSDMTRCECECECVKEGSCLAAEMGREEEEEGGGGCEGCGDGEAIDEGFATQ